MMCGAIFIELERPAQVARMERRERLTREVEVIRRNLTRYAFRTRIVRGEPRASAILFFTCGSSRQVK